MKKTLRAVSSLLAVATLFASLSSCLSIRVGAPSGNTKRQSVIDSIESENMDTDSFLRFFFDSDFYADDFIGGTGVTVDIKQFGRKGDFECYETSGGKLYFAEDEAGFYAMNEPGSHSKPPVNIGVSNRLPNIFDIIGADISMFSPSDPDGSDVGEPVITSDMIIPDETGKSAAFSEELYAEYARFIADKMGIEGEDRDAFISGTKGEGGYKDGFLSIKLTCENEKYKDFLFSVSDGKDKSGEYYYEYTFNYPTELPSEWAKPFEVYTKFSKIQSSGSKVTSLRIDAFYKASFMDGDKLINANIKLIGDMSLEDESNPTFELTYTLIQNNRTSLTARLSLKKAEGGNNRNMRFRFSYDGTHYSTVDFHFEYKTPDGPEYSDSNIGKIFDAIKNGDTGV